MAEVEQCAMRADEVATEVPQDTTLPGLPELVRPNQPISKSNGEGAGFVVYIVSGMGV